ncbi:MAG TPA: helix-turn-helix transcriptional regulator [Gemmatirosa sp.]
MLSLQVALGRAVRRLRAAAGHSQEAFADVVGVHRTYLGLIERGAVNVTLTTLEKLAAALRLTPGRLLDEAVTERERIISG